MKSILNSVNRKPGKSAISEDTAGKSAGILRVDDEIYSQVCFLETTANAMQHYLCDEGFEKDESYEEDLANMSMTIVREISDIRQKLKTIILSK